MRCQEPYSASGTFCEFSVNLIKKSLTICLWWGILQYFDTLQKGENGQAKADALLQLYNKETRTLTIKDAAGDSRVRGGSLVVVQLDLGDVKLQNLMLVEKCVHKYGESKHTMDLTVSGGDFSA